MLPRKTKIICTIGPSSDDVDELLPLIGAGMDAARLNFSHGSHAEHLRNIENIREAAEITGKNIAVIQDLQGPKIRIGKIENDAAELIDGNDFIITCDEMISGNSTKASTTYENLAGDVEPGSTLLLDDGYIILRVEKIIGRDIHTTIVKGGILKSNKGIIAPGVPITAPSLSEKDVVDLKFGLQAGVDFVALSFVRSEKDVVQLRDEMKSFGRVVPIISKIERFEGYDDLDDIINESDGIMVARGDLGLEMPAEQVPILQKEIIKKCNYYGKPVITATQMLESMISNPRPTRAEASDVANAVMDGTDCVMLSGETSIGKYPVEALSYMDKIIRSTEEKFSNPVSDKAHINIGNLNIVDALAKASCVIAEQLNASAIIPITKSGMTAQIIAKYRPRTPIVAITDSPDTLRQLACCWGVFPILANYDDSVENIIDKSRVKIFSLGFIRSGSQAVCIRGLNKSDTEVENLIKVVKL